MSDHSVIPFQGQGKYLVHNSVYTLPSRFQRRNITWSFSNMYVFSF